MDNSNKQEQQSSEQDNGYTLFCQRWNIEDVKKVEDMYHLEDLKAFLPDEPTKEDTLALNSVLGASFDNFYGYMDYQKSTNTFELIMQWREKTGKFEI